MIPRHKQTTYPAVAADFVVGALLQDFPVVEIVFEFGKPGISRCFVIDVREKYLAAAWKKGFVDFSAPDHIDSATI